MLNDVVSLVRRVAAVVAVLALAAGNVAVCAGWQATAEARMACCMNGASCPMHTSEGHDHASRSDVNQTQADSCCAASSQRHDSSSPGPAFAASSMIALAPVATCSLTSTVLPAQKWRALAPLLVSSVPKHLLLSVFLV
jgi:hypothetical protein